MRTVLVTGVSTGIGKSIAETLLDSDFYVIGSVEKKKILNILKKNIKINLVLWFLMFAIKMKLKILKRK